MIGSDYGDGHTLVDRLARLALERPEDVVYQFLVTGDVHGVVEERTFAGLRQRVRVMASSLRAVLPAGSRVLMLCSGGLEFVEAFWACLHAGLIAVPAYPPEPTRWHRTLPRLRAILADADANAVLMDRATADALAPQRDRSEELGRLPWFVLEDLEATDVDLPDPAPTDVAYLQYTSGSTGDPKGVIVSHANLVHTCEDLAFGWHYTANSNIVSWLPTFHDMGLIWGLLLPVHVGFRATLMNPVAFLQRPIRWLEAITAARGTHTAAPSFAYDLCVRKVKPDDLGRLDLSSMIAAGNAAEPVRVGTMNAFIERFGPVGFKPTAMCPGFGMAEATLKVTSSMPEVRPTVLQLSAAALGEGRIALAEGDDVAVPAVGCGRSALGTELAIVDPDSHRRREPLRVGEIWVRGPAVAEGYWGREEATRETFRAAIVGEAGGPWLRTGDLGFLYDGELFIAGRLKDMIIIRGRNLYPQDIELAVEGASPRVRPGCVAAFPVPSAAEDGEGLCVVAEAALDPAQPEASATATLEAVRHVVFTDFSILPVRVVLIAPQGIQKTSSGKIQRRGTRLALDEGTLEVVAEWRAPVAEPRTATREAVAAGPTLDRESLSKLLREAIRQVAPGPAIGAGATELTFESLGLDSVRGVELAEMVASRTQLKVPTTLIFDCPSLGSAVDRLLQLAAEDTSAELERDVWRFAESALDTQDLTDLLRAVVDSACQLFGADRGTVFLYDAERHELYSRLATAESPEGEAPLSTVGALRLPADRGIAGAALTSGATIHIPDAYSDPRFDRSHDARTGFRTRSIDAVPLLGRDGQKMGVLQLLNRREPGWDARGLRRLDQMARLAAHALARAVQREDSKAAEPIAIVSMACRFPGGVDSPEALWELVNDGRDEVQEVPIARWDVDRYFDADPDVKGRTYSRWGGFLGDITAFDAEFFGISPREAPSVDPQQRLLLETTAELFERVGWPLDSLKGSRTGVFVGICGNEYHVRAVSDLESMDAYSVLNTAHSGTTGRLSYWLGLQGPNVAVDTACSSSLVAMHLAAQSLRSGECAQAIAGGVNLLLDPAGHVYFSRLQGMSPTGRCRTFSADADGYVRAEGCGVVLLMRLSDAIAAGHPVLAVLRGSAVNQDGRSAGFTSPNGVAQQRVVREALSQAGVPPESVSYVECHGTATPLGDSIEVQALAAVYAGGRGPDDRLRLGTLKANFGHAEGAAGVAGVIKTVLCLQRGRLPANLHLGALNPLVPWDTLPVEPLGEAVAWSAGAGPRRAGVSAFGFSGTNAHVILEEAPPAPVWPVRAAPDEVPRLLVLSAVGADALAAQAARLVSVLDQAPSLGELAWSLARTRTAWSARLAVVARPEDAAAGYPQLKADLLAFAADGALPALAATSARAVPRGRNVAFVYPDAGGQPLVVGRDLLATSPVFAEAIDACDAAFGPHLGGSIRAVLVGDAPPGALGEGGVARLTHFAIGVGLTALWRSLGVRPTATVGEGVGEVLAAWAAGGLSLEDAARVVVAGGDGGVGAPLEGAGSTSIRFVATARGRAGDGAAVDARAGADDREAAASMEQALELLAGDDHAVFLAMGAGASLTGALTAAAARADGLVVETAPHDHSGLDQVLAALAQLWVGGAEIDTSCWSEGLALRAVPLPTYPFQRRRYWLEPTEARAQRAPAPAEPAEARSVPLREVPADQQEAAVRRLVLDALSAVTGRPPETLPTRGSFDELGLDSLLRVELRNRLTRAVGSMLPGTFTYDHDDVDSLARALRALAPTELRVPVPGDRTAPVPAAPTAAKAPSPAAVARAATSAEARAAILQPPLEEELRRALGLTHIDPHASLAALGVDEILGAELCLRLYRNLGVRVFPREILDCANLAELCERVATYVDLPVVADAAMPLAEIDRRVRSPFGPGDDAGETDHREILFILSPPRSGSTLLRVMLAGHSRLFAPQELHLTGYADMATYDRHLRGTALNMGILNVIGEVTSKAGAWNLYREWVREAVPTASVVDFIQSRIGDRVLVDKSPFFFDPLPVLLATARRYPNARFLHLIRHPASSIGSYVEQRFHAIFEQTRDLPPYDQAEWCWTRVHQGILEFQKHVPADRLTRLYFEDIVTEPERTMRRLCPALGLAYEPALLSPYSGHRMVSGGFQIGDPNFSQHRQIVAAKSTAWMGSPLPRPLRVESVEVAVALGYEPHAAWAATEPAQTTAAPTTTDDQAMGGLDLERDVELLRGLPVIAPRPASEAAPRTVLLTGATGFLGAFLLQELLLRTDARVRCLVRAASAEAGVERIRRNLASYGLWDDAFATRVEAVPGDLDQDGLGLDDAARASLRDVDAIYHCAARISWLMPYRLLRASNVLGMKRLVELALALGGPTLNVISSLGSTFVRPFHDEPMVRWIQDQTGLGTESIFELPLGYMETKWVVDRLADEARSHGLVVNRYNPGLICGHSQTGIDSLSDSQFVFALIKGSAQLGRVPDGHGWRFCPVDVVARDVVATSLLPGVRDVDLCIDSTTVMDPNDLVDVLRARGIDARIEAYASWRQQVLDLADRGEKDNALYLFTDTIFALTPLRFQGQRLQLDWKLQNRSAPEVARAALEPRAHLHRALLERMVDYYIRESPEDWGRLVAAR